MPKNRRVAIDDEHVAWIEDMYPGMPLSVLLNMLLVEFRNAHYVTPADFAAIGSKKLKELLEES